MTLNFSRRPIFSGILSEDKLASSIQYANRFTFKGIPDDNGDYYEGDRIDRGGVPIFNDVIDLLPSDPFGMNLNDTFTTQTQELNFFSNRAMKVQVESGSMEIYEASNSATFSFDGLMKKNELADGSFSSSGFISIRNQPEFVSFNNGGDARGASCRSKEHEVGVENSSSEDYLGDPHQGFLYALGYLGAQDLLSVERVCKSLRLVVQGDNLLWRSIHIDQPLNERISDDDLLRLTNRAQGNLECLSLVRCLGITNDGLKRVLDRNPRLEKLSVPDCTRLSMEVIVNDLKAFKSFGAHGIKYLRIGGRYDVTLDHLEELKSILNSEKVMENQRKTHKPRFFHEYLSFSCEDGRDIDIETCPKCQKLRLVYDCPVESCQEKQSSSQPCRACTMCIERCGMCGKCLNKRVYQETFSFDRLCSDCINEDIDLHQAEKMIYQPVSKHSIIQLEETKYQQLRV